MPEGGDLNPFGDLFQSECKLRRSNEVVEWIKHHREYQSVWSGESIL